MKGFAVVFLVGLCVGAGLVMVEVGFRPPWAALVGAALGLSVGVAVTTSACLVLVGDERARRILERGAKKKK